jgi:fumarate hydratase subunit beta
MAESIREIQIPLTKELAKKLKIGERVLITGKLYTARDAAHKKLIDLIKAKKKLPFDLKDQIIFYAGPTPPRPGETIGVIGPTTSYRMDPYTIPLLQKGLSAMIGKGQRSAEVQKGLKKYSAVYFVATGGVAALLKSSIISSRDVAYKELGAEAIRELIVEKFPVVVANDSFGHDLFSAGQKKFKVK